MRARLIPVCTGGGGACPPEDCDGPAGFMAGRNGVLSLDALEDLDTMTEMDDGKDSCGILTQGL